jgi:hypothetical protein
MEGRCNFSIEAKCIRREFLVNYGWQGILEKGDHRSLGRDRSTAIVLPDSEAQS